MDMLQCLNECVDRVLMSDTTVNPWQQHGGDPSRTRREKNTMWLIDNIMLIEAAGAGLTLMAEKLLLEYDLDPL